MVVRCKASQPVSSYGYRFSSFFPYDDAIQRYARLSRITYYDAKNMKYCLLFGACPVRVLNVQSWFRNVLLRFSLIDITSTQLFSNGTWDLEFSIAEEWK